MLSLSLRIAGVALGILALLKLATSTGTVIYTNVFQSWLDLLRDVVGIGFLSTLVKPAVILPALDFIRSFDIPIPPLQDHWQQVFVVLWILFAAVSRYAEASLVPLMLAWALTCALLTSVLAGLYPGSTTAVSLGIGAFFTLHPFNLMGSRALPAGFSVIAWLCEAAMNLVGLVSENPLYPPVVFVFLFGFCSLIFGLLTQRERFVERLSAPATSMGLDITATMFGAFGMTMLFANPPLL